jgi:hypothetical protein
MVDLGSRNELQVELKGRGFVYATIDEKSILLLEGSRPSKRCVAKIDLMYSEIMHTSSNIRF